MSSTALTPLALTVPPRVFGGSPLHTDGELLALGISSDGFLWSVEEPGELRQWSLATRRHQSTKPLPEAATVWAFNWAGRLIAAAGSALSVREVSSGQELSLWKPGSTWVTALAFQPGYAVLATGHDDGQISIWDWMDATELHRLSGRGPVVSALAFSPDGKHLAAAGEDRLIRVWEVAGGKQVALMKGHTDRIPALAWHPDGKRLFSSGWDTTVRVWDAATGEPIILLNSHAQQVHAIALSGDGQLLAAADSANAVHIWDTTTYKTLNVLRESQSQIACLAFSPDDAPRGNLRSPLLAWGGEDRIIYLWDARTAPQTSAGVDLQFCRPGLAVSRDGKRLHSLAAGADLRIRDMESGRLAGELEGSPLLRCMAASPDGRWLAGARLQEVDGQERATLTLWSADTGKCQATCDGQQGPITALAFAPDSALLAAGGMQSCDVWLWGVPSGEPAYIIPDAVDCSVEALAFQPGGTILAVAGIDWLATGGSDGQVSLWDIATRTLVRTFDRGATAIAFQPDGKRLAMASPRRTIAIREVNGDGAIELSGHTETVTALAYSPDGKWLASAGDDHTVRLWDAGSGESIAARELDNPIKALAFSANGAYLYTANGNTTDYELELEALLEG